MLRDARLGKEVVITVTNKIGVLADISKILADHGMNIDAVAGYALEDGTAKIMLAAEDPQRVVDALKKANYKSIKENEVVIVELENKTGALKFLTAKLAQENIDIKQVYGSTCTGSCAARLVLSTTDNEKALVTFRK